MGGQQRGCNSHTAPADVNRLFFDQTDTAVDAAAECMLACARCDIGMPVIVYPYGNDIVTGVKCFGEVYTETCISSRMASSQLSVDKHICLKECTVKFQ